MFSGPTFWINVSGTFVHLSVWTRSTSDSARRVQRLRVSVDAEPVCAMPWKVRPGWTNRRSGMLLRADHVIEW